MIDICRIMYDRDVLKGFHEKVILPLKDDEVYMIFSQARKKYGKLGTLEKDTMFNRKTVKRDSFEYFERGVFKAVTEALLAVEHPVPKKCIIPIQTLVFYVDLSPKSVVNAYHKAYNQFYRSVREFDKGLDKTRKHIVNFDRVYQSNLHKSSARKPYKIIDIDMDSIDFLMAVSCFIGRENITWVSKTNNGYHIIVEMNKTTGKLIHKDLKKEFNYYFESKLIELPNSTMTPIPGLLQGGSPVEGVLDMVNATELVM